MISERKARFATRGLAIISRAELFLVPFLVVPAISTGIFLASVTYNILVGFIIAVAYLLFIRLLAIPAATIMGVAGVRGEILATDVKQKLSFANSDFNRRSSFATFRDILIYKQDQSIGAQVRGASGQIVVSAGLLVGLLKRNRSARAVFSHEVAHVANGDKMYLAICGLYLIGGVLFAIIFPVLEMMHESHESPSFTVDMPNVLALWIFCCFGVLVQGAFLILLSRRREHIADSFAVAIVGRNAYLEMLSLASGTHGRETGDWFHPSLRSRRKNVQRGRQVGLSPSFGMLAIYAVYWGMGVFNIEGGDQVAGFGSLCVSTIAIVVELSRIILLFGREGTGKPRPEQRDG